MLKKLLLTTALLLCVVTQSRADQIVASTTLPDQGTPEHLYYMVSGGGYYATGTTAPAETEASYGQFAFYEVTGVDNAYYIYSYTAGQWLDYTPKDDFSNEYSGEKNFVTTNVNRNRYFYVDNYENNKYQISPYTTAGTLGTRQQYLNWHGGVGSDGSVVEQTTLGLWKGSANSDSPSDSNDAGSRWMFYKEIPLEYCEGEMYSGQSESSSTLTYSISSGSLSVNGTQAFTFNVTSKFQDFRSTCVAEVHRGDVIQITVSGTDKSQWGHATAYFDWNRDGVWAEDATEATDLYKNPGAQVTNRVTEITVPEDAAIGALGLRLCSGEEYSHKKATEGGPCLARLYGGLQTFEIIVVEDIATNSVTIPTYTEGRISVSRDGNTLANGAEVAAGDVLTITATANAGYEVATVTVNGTPLNGTTYTVGENESVVIAATFNVIPLFTATNYTFDGTTTPVKVPAQFATNLLAANELTVVVDYTIDAANVIDEGNYSFAAAVNSSATDFSTGTSNFLSIGFFGASSNDNIALRYNDGLGRASWWQNQANGRVFTGENKHMVIASTATGATFYLDDDTENSFSAAENTSTTYTLTFKEVSSADAIYLGGFITGAGTNKYLFNGKINSIRFYGAALNSTEVGALSYTGLVSDIYQVTEPKVPEVDYTLTTLAGEEIEDLRAVVAGTELKLTINEVESGYRIESVSWGDETLTGTDGVYTFLVNDSRTLNIEISEIKVTVVANGATYTLRNEDDQLILGIDPATGDPADTTTPNETRASQGEFLTLEVHYAPNNQKVTSVTWKEGENEAQTLESKAGEFTVSSKYTFQVTEAGTLTINTESVKYCNPNEKEDDEGNIIEWDDLTYTDNYVKTLKLYATDATWKGFSLNLHPSETHCAYLDYTTLGNGIFEENEAGETVQGILSLPVNTGSTVNITLTLHGDNINRGHLYIDFNKDGTFNPATYTDSGNGELVSYSGTTLESMPSFTVPDNLVGGMYRARFKVDAVTDPCNFTGMTGNEGTIAVDFMLTVTNTKSNLSTDIEEEVADSVELYYANGAIYTNLEGEIAIYDLSGKLVRRAQFAPVAVDDLESGIYIVRANGKTLKFVK